MKNLIYFKRKAFGLLEVVIALGVAIGALLPILQMITASRTDTTSSISYLRAMELANEVIEWANVATFDEVDKLEGLSGTIIESNGGNIVPIKINAVESDNIKWKNSKIFEKNLQYSEQYSNAYFYRIIKVTPLKGNYFQNDMLKKVSVTVKWCEGKKPRNLNLDSEERNKQIQLSVLVINDDNLLY